LEVSDGKARLARWQALAAAHGESGERGHGYALLRFRDGAGVLSELEELVESERSCCAFLGWQLERAGNVLTVRITGNDQDLATLPVDL
jgi:hypothetical protein